MTDDIFFHIKRLPLGANRFSTIRQNNKIYVDKTSLIYEFAILDTPIFFSRPRRFGKTLLLNTLSCLFANGIEDFRGLDIEKKWQDKTYQVVRLDFSGLANTPADFFIESLDDVLIIQFKMQGIVSKFDELKIRRPNIILKEICEKIDNYSTVLLIDEYDAPLLHHIDNPDELQNIMNVLNDFYAIVKEYTYKFRLIFITGVTRTSHISIFSAFNNLKDISLDERFNSLLGFTQNDLEQYFDEYIDVSAKILNMKKEDLYQRLKQYYDGFQFAINAKETIYNPWSILSFF